MAHGFECSATARYRIAVSGDWMEIPTKGVHLALGRRRSVTSGGSLSGFGRLETLGDGSTVRSVP